MVDQTPLSLQTSSDLNLLYRLVLVVIPTLIILGVVLDFAASGWRNSGSITHLYHAGIALGTFALFAYMPLWMSLRFVTIGLIICCLLLPYLLLFTDPLNSARRWIDLGLTRFQPSEFIKVLLPVIFARAISANEFYRSANFPLKLLLAYLPISLLVLLQPDFGQAMLILSALSVQFVLAGFAIQALIAFAVALLAFSITLSPLLTSTLGHVASRFNQFLQSDFDRQTQLGRAIDLIENGGLFGNPVDQTLTFPHAQNDFAYALIANSFGAIGSITVLVAICGICLCCIYIVNRQRTGSVIFRHMVSGIAVVTLLQIFAHTYSNLGLAPTKGTTFPFLSRGGSSLVAFAIGWGLVTGVLKTAMAQRDLIPIPRTSVT